MVWFSRSAPWAWSALGKGLWITASASAFLTSWCLYVPWRLHKSPKLFPDPKTSDDMLGYLKAERRATQGQYELLRGILRWYLGPCGFGVLLFCAGNHGLSLSTLIYTLVVLSLYGLIYLLTPTNHSIGFRQHIASMRSLKNPLQMPWISPYRAGSLVLGAESDEKNPETKNPAGGTGFSGKNRVKGVTRLDGYTIAITS